MNPKPQLDPSLHWSWMSMLCSKVWVSTFGESKISQKRQISPWIAVPQTIITLRLYSFFSLCCWCWSIRKARKVRKAFTKMQDTDNVNPRPYMVWRDLQMWSLGLSTNNTTAPKLTAIPAIMTKQTSPSATFTTALWRWTKKMMRTANSSRNPIPVKTSRVRANGWSHLK